MLFLQAGPFRQALRIGQVCTDKLRKYKIVDLWDEYAILVCIYSYRGWEVDRVTLRKKSTVAGWVREELNQ